MLYSAWCQRKRVATVRVAGIPSSGTRIVLEPMFALYWSMAVHVFPLSTLKERCLEECWGMEMDGGRAIRGQKRTLAFNAIQSQSELKCQKVKSE